jgi:hypothetical protein
MSSGQPGPRPDHATIEQPLVKSLASLQDTLQDAVRKAFNPHPAQYRRVVVQFFKFKNGDLDLDGVERELAIVLKNLYGFEILYHQIGTLPNTSPTLEVQHVCYNLQANYGGEKCLLILVFSGHGEVEYFAQKRTLWLGYVNLWCRF